MIRYYCDNDHIYTNTSICSKCGQRTRIEGADIYWCDECNIPIYEEKCGCCGNEGRRIASDLRPVFPEERLLIEIVLEKAFEFKDKSVWNCAGKYYVNGKKINFSIKELANADTDYIKKEYDRLSPDNDYRYFNEMIGKFVIANARRYSAITNEATDYIREKAAEFEDNEMFVSFSGGKDSTVVSDLVMRALSKPSILHIFGDTTLEFDSTMEYVDRFKKNHRSTPVLSSRNKEKDFYELMEILGPPSRVMRWCCTVFKTGAITRKIATLFKDKKRILTFYGIRRSESASRSKYDRESDSPKITKQIVVSPIIDWFDFDVWLYMLSSGIDFNDAYRLGYARVGCFCCPNNSGWSEFVSKVHMKDRMQKFHDELVEFASKVGKPDPEDYVNDGKWKARQGGNGLEHAKKSIVSFEPCATEENTFNYELQRPIEEQLYELFKPFGYINKDMGNKRLGEVYVIGVDGKPKLRLQGRVGQTTLKVTILDYHIAKARNIKTAEERIKCQITKYQMCMGCLACESVCRFNAISIKEQKDGSISYVIDDSKCKRCTECVNHFDAGCYMRKVLTIKRK